VTPTPTPAGTTSISAPDRPLRRDAERNRQRILVAARELFAHRGLEVTLDDIAHHADLGVGTVYRRFPSREHLVEALFEEEIDQMATCVDDAAGQADSWQALVDFLAFTTEAAATDRGLREIMVSSTYGRDRIARARERLVPVVSRLIARAQADGHLRADIEPTDMALVQVMIGAVAEYSQQVRPDLWRRYLTILLDGLRPHRDRATPLPQPALDEPALDEAMRSWRPCRR
jgi:AcrR family transcriptional regulator